MPEIFLEFIGDASPWLVPLLVVLAVWGKFNWAALNNPDKKASFDRAVGWLREDSFGQLYLGFLGGLIDRVANWIGDRQQLSQASMAVPQPKGLTHRVFGFNPFTAESYEKCLWLAFMYPALAYSITWILGAEGFVGNINLLEIKEVELNLGQRWPVMCGMVLFMSTIVWLTAHNRSRSLWLALFMTLFITTNGSWPESEEVKQNNISVFLAAFSVLVAAGIIAVFLKILHEWSDRKENISWFWLSYSVFLIISGITFLKLNVTSTDMLIMLLMLLLPIFNAPLDWLSLGFTRGLLQAVRTGNHSGWLALTWAITDLLLALIFLFLITTVLVGVTALGNAIAGKTLMDIGCILSKVQDDTSHPDNWWIYFMLLSTLIPTLIHFALAGGAATIWLPRKWRTQLADGLEEDTHKTFGAWAYLTFTPVIGFILMPLGLLWSLWWLLNANGGALGTLLLSWAEGLAKWADPSMKLVCGAGG